VNLRKRFYFDDHARKAGRRKHLIVGTAIEILADGRVTDWFMSGSPILNGDGAAIGLISTGSTDSNINPSLSDCLPPWLLRKLVHHQVKPRGRKPSRLVG
jgi:hypothetical protein